MLMACEYKLDAAVCQKLRSRIVESYDKVAADYPLNRQMVKQIVVHHQNRISAVRFCLPRLLKRPA